MMEIDAKTLVKNVYENGTAEQLMSVISSGAKLMSSSTVPFKELELYNQAAIVTVQVLLAYLTDLGVLEDVQVRH